jgi:hypothetical protein
LNAAVSKTAERRLGAPWVRIPPPPLVRRSPHSKPPSGSSCSRCAPSSLPHRGKKTETAGSSGRPQSSVDACGPPRRRAEHRRAHHEAAHSHPRRQRHDARVVDRHGVRARPRRFGQPRSPLGSAGPALPRRPRERKRAIGCCFSRKEVPRAKPLPLLGLVLCERLQSRADTLALRESGVIAEAH